MSAQVAHKVETEIVRIPRVCSGYAHISGTKLPVWAIVSYLEEMSVDDLLKGFPYLTRAGIEAALTYYKFHKEEVDGDRRDSEAA